MTHNLLQSDLDRQIKSFMAEVYPNANAWQSTAAKTLFRGIIHGGDTLVNRFAAFVEDNPTSPKGTCERVSGWLEKYDFATPAAQWLATHNAPRVTKDATIAVDLSDLSKPFGGKGMEGMAKGWDGSRHALAMGHTFAAAVLVAPSRQSVHPLAFAFEPGRKPLDKRLHATVRRVHEKTRDNGILALDRGSDSEGDLTFLQSLGHRAVVRVSRLKRDVFGTGKTIDKQLDGEKRFDARLFTSNGGVQARLSWRVGHLGELHDTPVLLVRSEFGGKVLYLYWLSGAKAAADMARHAASLERPGQAPEAVNFFNKLALLAAQAYLDRWQIETFFLRVKQDFSLENARVRTFQRLRNLFYLCVLGYSFCTDVLPSGASYKRMLKVLKDNFQRVTFRMQVFLSGLRTLLGQPRLNVITGRPRKRVWHPAFQMVLNL